MIQKGDINPAWLLGIILTTACLFGTICTQDTNASDVQDSTDSPVSDVFVSTSSLGRGVVGSTPSPVSRVPESTNSSGSSLFDILDGLNIQKQIQELQRDGGLESLVYSVIAGVSADLPIQGECVKDIFTMLRGVTNFDMWAIQMLDAIGKPHSGILIDIDFKWYGSYDGCLGVKAVTYSNVSTNAGPEHHFDGKYCKLGFPIPAALASLNPGIASFVGNIEVGVCIPDSCNTADMQSIMYLVDKYALSAPPEYKPNAECHDGFEVETKTIVAIIILSIIGVVVVIGTLYDIYVRLTETTVTAETHCKDAPVTQHNGDMNGVIKVDLITTNDVKVNRDLNNKTHGEVTLQENETSVAQTVKPSDKRSTLEKIFLSFSVYSNGLKILNTSQPKGALTCINGMRFLSMTWVILGHSLTLQVKGGLPYVLGQKVKQWTFYGIYSATVSVDTFFTMSGLLVAYLTLREIAKRGGAKRINWFMFYFHRYWRLTPAYMLTLMVYAATVRYIGDGPKWPQKDTIGEACEKNWWTNLLYINNYVDTDHSCFGWSWYLADDMQFYILSPLIIIPLFHNVFAGGVVAGVFLIGTTVARAIIDKQHEYPALFGNYYGPKAKDGDFMKNMYFPAHTRMGPYIIGLLTGYLLYRYKDNFKMKKVWTFLGWFLCMGSIILVIYGVYADDGKHFLSLNETVAYVTLHRTAWGVAVSWIIFACATGHGGWINDLLSWSPFAPLGRLSYCAYLVHLICMNYHIYTQRMSVYITDLHLIYYYLGNVVISYFFAFGISLLFEAPMMGLEKVLFRRNRK